MPNVVCAKFIVGVGEDCLPLRNPLTLHRDPSSHPLSHEAADTVGPQQSSFGSGEGVIPRGMDPLPHHPLGHCPSSPTLIQRMFRAALPGPMWVQQTPLGPDPLGCPTKFPFICLPRPHKPPSINTQTPHLKDRVGRMWGKVVFRLPRHLTRRWLPSPGQTTSDLN